MAGVMRWLAVAALALAVSYSFNNSPVFLQFSVQADTLYPALLTEDLRADLGAALRFTPSRTPSFLPDLLVALSIDAVTGNWRLAFWLLGAAAFTLLAGLGGWIAALVTGRRVGACALTLAWLMALLLLAGLGFHLWASSEQRPMEVFDANLPVNPQTLLMLPIWHGGGFVIGDIETHEPYCAEAARQLDMPVISIDYRLAPEHPFPAAPDDCEAATRWIADNIPCTGLILSGDSAGGNLAIVTAMALRDKAASKPVIAQYPIYPTVDDHGRWPSYGAFKKGYLLTEETMDFFMSSYAGDGSWRIEPLKHDQKGMPPTVIITAGLDPLRDQGRAYAAKLIETGIRTTYLEASGNIHGFICLRKGIPSSHQDITNGINALKQLLGELAA
jgi:acetyl esterase